MKLYTPITHEAKLVLYLQLFLELPLPMFPPDLRDESSPLAQGNERKAGFGHLLVAWIGSRIEREHHGRRIRKHRARSLRMES